MITHEKINGLKDWLETYTRGFLTQDEKFNQNIELKWRHCLRVSDEIVDIGRSLNLSPEELLFSQSLGLLHDTGRFKQFADYQTFADHQSVNHAMVGLQEIKKNGLLDFFSAEEQKILSYAISWHNKALLPEAKPSGDDRMLFFAKLIRDADKIDIYRVAWTLYTSPSWDGFVAADFNLPDVPDISEEVYADLEAERIVDARHLKTLTDFKILQIGWIYDINYPRTFQLLKERGYIKRIIKSLPEKKRTLEVMKKIEPYLEKMSEFAM